MYNAYISGALLPRASICSLLGAARVDCETKVDINVQRLGEQVSWQAGEG
jgi:hypothetical protein